MTLANAIEAAFVLWLRSVTHEPFRPDSFSLTITQVQTPMGISFKVTANLPEFAAMPDPNDVASQELLVSVDGVDNPVLTPAIVVGPAPVELGTFALGQVVQASLQYLDAAGNRGPGRVASVTVTDTIAPGEPGEFDLSVEQVVV